MKKGFIFTYLVFLFSRCFSIELSLEEYLILDGFFRTSIEKSEAGYVLYGEKPVCHQGYHFVDNFHIECPNHQCSVFLREGARVLNRLKLASEGDIILHCYKSASESRNWIDVLFINKPLLLKTIQENLPLFQYVLGPKVTPQSLYNALTQPKGDFSKTLKDDKVLIGILLGFGTQNALYCSRSEIINNSIFSPEQVPLKGRALRDTRINPYMKNMLLFSESSREEIPDLAPSFGYRSLDEEAADLKSQIILSSKKLDRSSPRFVFGRLKENAATDQFIAALENTQDRIVSKFLSSKTFLKNVMDIIYPHETITMPNTDQVPAALSFTPSERTQLPLLVAASIWENLKNETKNYRQAFIEGMKDLTSNPLSHCNARDLIHHEKVRAFSKIVNHLNEAEHFFERLSHDSSVSCLYPAKLYCQTIRQGSGSMLKHQTKVKLHYTINTPKGETLVDTRVGGNPAFLNLFETIPGLSHGIKGMKKGEVREIFIHPSLAYGIYTTLEKGIYLKANVELIDYEEASPNEQFPELQFLELLSSSQREEAKNSEKSERVVGFRMGQHAWQHYKKSSYYTLNEVLDCIDQCEQGIHYDLTDQNEQDLLNRLHWNLYSETID